MSIQLDGTSGIIATGNVTANAIRGNIFTDGYFYANGQPFSGGGGGGAVFVTSNISAVVAGQPITVVADFANITYPGGVFTITQSGSPPPPPGNILLSDVWSSSSSNSKNAYLDFANSSINISNISLTISVANTTFSIQASDDITIGGSIVTGANLLGLGITGVGGTYTVPSAMLASSVQTANSVAVTANLTTVDSTSSATGTTLINIQPTLFNVGTITGTFANSANAPFFLTEQPLSWNTTGVVGTITGGNITLSGSSNITLGTAGQVSGTTANIDSAVGPYNLSATYTGSGTNGSGTRSVTVTGSVNAISTFTVLFSKQSSSNANPNFTISDTYNPSPFAFGTVGQGSNNVGALTSATPAVINWYAIPCANTVPYKLKFDKPPFDGVTMTPPFAGLYPNQVIDGVTYQVIGVDGFNAATYLYVTSS